MHYIKCLTAAAAVTLALGAQAETVLLSENFDGDYTESFPYYYDGDGQLPNTEIAALFLSPQHGYYMPWWVMKESASDPDRFIGSHSYYYYEDITSNDWLISKAIDIPSTGFVLEFDAQSVLVRQGERLSDLRIYITDKVVDKNWQPEACDFEIQQVPAGATAGVTTNEWAKYKLSLDAWAGKRVYINFVNQNTEKDLLCINNVKVYRHDPVELYVDQLPIYTSDDAVAVKATVKVIDGNLSNWKLTFSNGIETKAEQGDALALGTEQRFEAVFSLGKDSYQEFTVQLTADGMQPVSASTSTTALAFEATRRVLLEETTGLWCGNCPLGIYNIESLVEDANVGERVLPVAVHIKGTGNDLMAFDDYSNFIGLVNVAPMVRMNRTEETLGFTTAYDVNYDPTNDKSFAYRVHQALNEPALFDVSVSAEWIIEGQDTIAVKAIATVVPALTMKDKNYNIGFILTENNVGLDNHPYWRQENYLSGYPFESTLGGWTELPEKVRNARYHFVARAVPAFAGYEGSLPAELEAEKEYQFSTIIDIPNTYQESEKIGMLAPAIMRRYCELTAFVSNGENLTIANCARVPLSDDARQLFTAQDLLAGVAAIECDMPQTGIIYDLQGRRVGSNPSPGIYLQDGKKLLIK